MKNILITGAAGFIGANFLKIFLKKVKFNRLILLDNLTYSSNFNYIKDYINIKNVKFIKGNICNKNLVKNIFNIYKIDVIFNFAAETHVDNSIKKSDNFVKTNFFGVHNLISNAHLYWKNDLENKLFFQISTDEVFGHLQINEEKFNENTKFDPRSPYSSSKAAADLLIKSFWTTYKIPYVITHCSNNFGPNQHKEKLIPKVINNILLSKKIPIYGNGLNIRDWIYVDDHCDALIKIFKKRKFNTTFNIGGNNQISNLYLVKKIIKLLKNNKKIKIDRRKNLNDFIKFVDDRLGHDFRYDLNTSKIYKTIGFKPSISINKGLINTINWYLSFKKN
tara:strand:+ start:12983 stop:13987 length:1005 start_codon:yes stop_codon:yes gene_type:complete